MDNPSSTLPEQVNRAPRPLSSDAFRGAVPRSARADAVGTLIIVDLGDAISVDLAEFMSRSGELDVFLASTRQNVLDAGTRVTHLSIDELSGLWPKRDGDDSHDMSLLLVLNPLMREREHRAIDQAVQFAHQHRPGFVGIISSFRFHLGDPVIEELEETILGAIRDLTARIVVFRPGHILSQRGAVGQFLRRFAPFYPLFPRSLTSCFVGGAELFGAIDEERRKPTERPIHAAWPNGDNAPEQPRRVGRSVSDKARAITLLGANRSWRDMAYESQTAPGSRALPTIASTMLSWLLVGHAAALVLNLLSRRSPRFRQWNVQTLKPRSIREIVSLCHRLNRGHVRVVGYNTGVNHFGHRYKDKTIVSTVRCHRVKAAGPNSLKADCGATIRTALDFLAQNSQELYVVPNYSYVCLGTAFFVPIHGSAVEFSTVADTVCGVVLYDPDTDRIIAARRHDPEFGEHVYNLNSQAVVLRLKLLTKPKAAYFVSRATLTNPSADEILGALRDPEATNVEIRQGHAASAKVTVARYYTDAGKSSAPALELPRDALGRLWDRLEENPVSSFLMHALSRHVAWHTELFLTPREFEIFWREHHSLPLRKIQLRYLRHDGQPHSPFRTEDCVSADLFLFRMHKSRFLEYLKTRLPSVRTNPGKHSA